MCEILSGIKTLPIHECMTSLGMLLPEIDDGQTFLHTRTISVLEDQMKNEQRFNFIDILKAEINLLVIYLILIMI